MKVACRIRFPTVEEGVSALPSPPAGAVLIPTSHGGDKVLELHMFPSPH